jgi:hypothetical protein
MHWRNNVLIFERRGLTRYTDPYRFHAAANAWIGPKARPDIQGAGGLHLQSIPRLQLRDPAALDLRPADGSPLIDAGVPIPDEPSNAEQAIGQPDIGPFEHGLYDRAMPGDHWPRPRRRVFNAAPPTQLSGEDLPPRLVKPTMEQQ